MDAARSQGLRVADDKCVVRQQGEGVRLAWDVQMPATRDCCIAGKLKRASPADGRPARIKPVSVDRQGGMVERERRGRNRQEVQVGVAGAGLIGGNADIVQKPAGRFRNR